MTKKFILASLLGFYSSIVFAADCSRIDDYLKKFNAYFNHKGNKVEEKARADELRAELGTIKYKARSSSSDTYLPNCKVAEKKFNFKSTANNDIIWIARMVQGEAETQVVTAEKLGCRTATDPDIVAYCDGTKNHAASLIWTIVQYQYTSNTKLKYSIGKYMQQYSTPINPNMSTTDKGICDPNSTEHNDEFREKQCGENNISRRQKFINMDWGSISYIARRSAVAFALGCLNNPNPKSISFLQYLGKRKGKINKGSDGVNIRTHYCKIDGDGDGNGGNDFYSNTKKRYHDSTKWDGSEVVVETPDGNHSGVENPIVTGSFCPPEPTIAAEPTAQKSKSSKASK